LKNKLSKFIIFSLIVILGYFVYIKQNKLDMIFESSSGVIIVHSLKENNSSVIDAYISILEEEGVSYYLMDASLLLSVSPEDVSIYQKAIIFPNGINGYLNKDISLWLKEYTSAGGNIMLVGDAGSKTMKDDYLEKGSIFNDLIGIQTSTYEAKRDESFIKGNIKFSKKEYSDYFDIPEGKTDDNSIFAGYMYGPLLYSFANAKIINRDSLTLYAYSIYNNEQVPILAGRQIKDGEILYVNLPLGYLKGHSDDLLPRSIIKTFLFKMAHIPHIVSAPNGRGGLVINWHIDSALELEALPWLLENGYFFKEIEYSMHITAGPDCDKLGDGTGFDAGNKGRKIVETLMNYGTIGSHGGWAHNWFAENLENGNMDIAEMKHYIKINNQTLEKITGYPIKEYAAPDGVFYQPSSTVVMKELGIESYYYPGDSSSAPNRTFYDGKMVSKDIIAFPVMTFGKLASLNEFSRAGYSGDRVENILKNVVDFVAESRSVRLYYSHPYDIHLEPYQEEVKKFLSYAVSMQKSGKIEVKSMGYFRKFLLKLIGTRKEFHWHDSKLDISIHTLGGVADIALAIPKRHDKKQLRLKGYDEDENYYYIPTDTNGTDYIRSFVYE